LRRHLGRAANETSGGGVVNGIQRAGHNEWRIPMRRGGEATLAPAARPANRGPRPRAINRQERAAQTIRMTARHSLAQLLTMRTTIRQPDGMRGRARLSLTLAAALAIASLANALCLWALI
jgi:hypothetical protein